MYSRVLALSLVLGLYGCSTVNNQVEAKTTATETIQTLPYIELPEVRQFIDDMGSKHNYDRELLTQMFTNTYKREQVITKSDNQPEVLVPVGNNKYRRTR